MNELLSPNIAPPTTIPAIKAGFTPVLLATSIATGINAAIVPIDVPIAKLKIIPMRNTPGRIKFCGNILNPKLVTEETACILVATPWKAPAKMNITTIVIKFVSPPPWQKSFTFSDNFIFFCPFCGGIAKEIIAAMIIPTNKGILSNLPLINPDKTYKIKNPISGIRPVNDPFTFCSSIINLLT